MKMKTLFLLAAASSPLLLAQGAEGGFVGLFVENLGEVVAGRVTIRVFAQFDGADDPLDEVIGVFGDVLDPMVITTSAGSFFNTLNPLLFAPMDRVGDTGGFAPGTNALGDSYVGIGGPLASELPDTNSNGFPGPDSSSISPTFSGLLDGTPVNVIGDGWTQNNPPGDQGRASNYAGNRVFLVQITSGVGGDIQGVFNIELADNDSGTSATERALAFSAAAIPAPGAFALLGLAGLVGRPRRRRA